MKTGQLGRIIVDEFLQVEGNLFVYAIGDNALALNPYTKEPVPAAAQFALQQGRLVANNIYATIFGGVRRPYRPKVLGEVVSLGRHLAIGWLALPLSKKNYLCWFFRESSENSHSGKTHLSFKKRE